MFSGIVETMAQVVKIETEQTNKHFTLRNPYPNTMGIDQSIAHNGVCLTVVKNEGDLYTVTAMQETLRLTNLDSLKVGDWVNLERAMTMDKLLDGHIVQGHVDQTAVCTAVEDQQGSYTFTFEYACDADMASRGYLTVDKGSVTVNGVSLTVCQPTYQSFQVNIIPYTYDNTNFHAISVGTRVNIEFDIIGKYIARISNFAPEK